MTTNTNLLYCIEYNNVQAMKSDTSLTVGSICSTLGYYSPNDGGGAQYRIVSSGSPDNGYIHKLNNNLFAQMIIQDNSANLKQFGAVGDGTTDNTTALLNALSCSKIFDLLIPSGTYLYSQPLHITNANPYKYVHGSCNYNTWDNYHKTTILLYSPQNENTTALKISGSGTRVSDFVVKCKTLGLNTSGINFVAQYGYFERLTTINFDDTSLTFFCPYSNLSMITAAFNSEATSYANEHGNFNLMADFPSGSGSTSININQLILGAPTYCIHNKGLVMRGKVNLINNLMLPSSAQTPLIFEDALSCVINNPYFEYNAGRINSYAPIVSFLDNTKGCRINNGYMSGTFRYENSGMNNTCDVFSPYPTTPSYVVLANSTNYIDFHFEKSDNNTPYITNGLGSSINNTARFYMGEITGSVVDFTTESITFDTQDDSKNICISMRIKKNAENINSFAGKTICFGCRYNSNSTLPESQITGNVQGLSTNSYCRGQGENGIVQTIATIPLNYFDSNNYLYFSPFFIRRPFPDFEGTITAKDFFFYIIEDTVDYIPPSINKKGDVLLGNLIFPPEASPILVSSNKTKWKLGVDNNGNLYTEKVTS